MATRLGSPGINLLARSLFPDAAAPAATAVIGARSEHTRIRKARNGLGIGRITWIEQTSRPRASPSTVRAILFWAFEASTSRFGGQTHSVCSCERSREAAHGDLKIMLPMVTLPRELATARAFLEDEVTALERAAFSARRPPLGIMVEVPAAAITIAAFDADFFSIGSNDVTQYVTAAGRDIDGVADLADPLHPAVLRLIAHVARHGRETGRDVSLCGDAAADPAMLPSLIAAGLRTVSVAPARLARTKAAIAALDTRALPAAARSWNGADG